MLNKPRILLYDIESTPNIGYTWGMWEQTVIEFVEEWKLLCFAYKWLDEKKVTCVSRRNFKDVTELSLVKALHDILSEADIVITHNGVSFDNKKANAKFVEYGLKPIKPAQQIDTKQLAKSNFAFNSNSLDNLGKLLKVGRKTKRMDFSVWLGCMKWIANRKESAKDFRLMEKYNKNDVLLLERIYLKLRPWMTKHPNVAQISQTLNCCPKCGSDKLQKKGMRYSAKTVWRQYVCIDCGGYSKGETLAVPKPTLVNL